jgi:hypothetical protein
MTYCMKYKSNDRISSDQTWTLLSRSTASTDHSDEELLLEQEKWLSLKQALI